MSLKISDLGAKVTKAEEELEKIKVRKEETRKKRVGRTSSMGTQQQAQQDSDDDAGSGIVMGHTEAAASSAKQ
jgi:hypothetical protein